VLDVSGKWVILVNDSYSHRLRLSPGYQAMLSNADKEETQKFLQGKLNSALWLLKAIEQRRTTLYKITDFILEYQLPFFAQGVKHLRPMRLKDVAEALGIHESTVSRAVSGKYLQTPRGIFAFKFFFAANLDTINGVGAASTGVKQVIAEIVEGEDKANPLTDLQIAQCLQGRGVKISRRTVAKYREQLAIPSSTLRRRWQ
jgi:RNA polymerase sigma-54 factor